MNDGLALASRHPSENGIRYRADAAFSGTAIVPLIERWTSAVLKNRPTSTASSPTATPRKRWARAFVFHGWRPRRLWIIPVMIITSVALVYSGTSASAENGVRLMTAVAYVLTIMPAAAGFVWVLIYTLTLRNLRHRVFDGAILQTGFDEDLRDEQSDLSVLLSI